MKLFLNNFFNDLDLNLFMLIFKKTFNENIEYGSLEDSDILFESVFGSSTLLYYKKWKYSFLFQGESDRRLPLFMGNRMHTLKDYSCILKGEHTNSNIVELPLFVLYCQAFNFTDRFIKHTYDYNRFSLKYNENFPPKDICVIVSSMDSEGRNIFFNLLDKKIKVDYAGAYNNNVPQIHYHHSSPEFIDFVSQYKFIITMENSKNNTYITEKILHGFAANTIPVYWGSDHITDYFNEERFINVADFDTKTMNESIDRIVSLINNKEEYLKIINKPIFKNNRIPFTIDSISHNMKLLLNIAGAEQKTTFVTFGGPSHFHKQVTRICREATNLNYFTEICGFTDIDLKNDLTFWSNHRQFIEHNSRGYGYWMWKPYLIKKVLDKINMNDIIVYCDAGCTVNENGKGRLLEYINMINNNDKDYGIISFQLEFKEVHYTKKKVCDYFEYNMTDNPQCIALCIIIRKNNHSMNIIDKWVQSSMNYSLINDDITNNEHVLFKEHRHDQSIFSVLVNKYGSIKLLDETYFSPNWNGNGKQYPFHATRIK